MGFEPTTDGITIRGSTIELPTPYLASPEGLEPPLTVLETAVLPLHQRDISYTKIDPFRDIEY